MTTLVLPIDHVRSVTQKQGVDGHSSDRDHDRSDLQALPVAVGSSGGDHHRNDTHSSTVPADSSPAEATHSSFSKEQSPRLEDSLLLIFADALDDLERIRIATENRARSLAQVKGMAGTPEETRLLGMVASIKALEHDAELQLGRALRKHPLGPWVKRTVGVGEKQGGRLLAAIGDPASRSMPSQLWAYCGLHVLHPGQGLFDTQNGAAGVQQISGTGHPTNDTQVRSAGVAPRKQRGQKANWSTTAKMRVFLVAESCIKQMHSPYRADYDAGRTKYADSVHNHACVRCGPAGKPAPAGSPLSAGHQHARAMRLVMKAILKDLWREAKTINQGAAQ